MPDQAAHFRELILHNSTTSHWTINVKNPSTTTAHPSITTKTKEKEKKKEQKKKKKKKKKKEEEEEEGIEWGKKYPRSNSNKWTRKHLDSQPARYYEHAYQW